MTNREELITVRDGFKDITEIMDKLIELDEREDNNEEIDEKEAEALLGKFLLKIVELQSKFGNMV